MCIVAELWHTLGENVFGRFCAFLKPKIVGKCWKILENKEISILLSKLCEENETVGKMKLCGK